MSGMSLGELQAAFTAAARLDRLEFRMILSQVLGLSRIELITRDQRILSEAELARIEALVQRREQGEPMAYLLGQREFYGLNFQVNPAVLIPRPETELLLELALARLPAVVVGLGSGLGSAAARVLDMGTGSGVLAVALAHTRPDCVVSALDNSGDALAVARANAQQHQVAVSFMQSDWYSALPVDACFDLIISNPPYIHAQDRHLTQGDLRFEPLGALTDHADGLSALRQIVAGAPRHLAAGGWLLMEHGYDQAAAVRALLAAHGFAEVQSWRDLAGIERVSGGLL